MNIDELQFNASQIAEISGADLIAVHTWTSRGLADPHRAESELKRGRGIQRLYSLRDALRFHLMMRLHKQLEIPLKRGIRVCEMVFGDGFNPTKAAFMVLRQSASISTGTTWCADIQAVGDVLKVHPLGTVINTKQMFDDVEGRATRILKNKESK